MRFDHEKNEHIVTIKFKLPLVDDNLDYKNPDDKSKGYKVGKGNETGFISPAGGGVYQGNNSSSWSTTSDRRIKKNIVDNSTGLDAINQIRVRNFEYRTPDEIDELPTHAAIDKEGGQVGVIAQEIQEILPDVVK